MQWAVLFLAISQLAAAQSQCVKCHPAETKLHAQTAMANAMLPALTTAFAKQMNGKTLSEGPNGFLLSYRPGADALEVTAELGNKRADGAIEWVLGAGRQGQTPVVRAGKDFFESRVSYFSKLDRYGITIGQPAGASNSAEAALGLKESRRDAETCLACHSTGLTADLEPVQPGVQCERCHQGANRHAATDGKSAVANPGKLTSRQLVELCGECHRNKPPVDDRQIENVRFQPLRLMKSKCFVSGDINCLTCHVAHQDAVRKNDAFYNGKCTACHGVTVSKMHKDDRANGNCVSCHMPAVQLHPGLRFTDHFIRVVAE